MTERPIALPPYSSREHDYADLAIARRHQLTSQEQHVLEIAFKPAIRKIGLVDRDDPIRALVAKRIVDLHRQGVTDAVALTELTIR